MDANRAAALMIRGMLLELPQERRTAVMDAYDSLRATVEAAGDEGLIALALLGAEKGSD